MSLVEQWTGLEGRLDPRWTDIRLSLTIGPDEARDRAAALLAPAGPGLTGRSIRISVARNGGSVGPEAVRRMLQKIDAEGIDGRLELVSSSTSQPEQPAAKTSLAADWDAALAVLPADWSDLLCDLELVSSNDIALAAVLAGPLNPMQSTGRPGFHFRSAHTAGYGASAGMVRRCFERLDEAGVAGQVQITRVLCDTHPVGAQGAMFLAGERPA
ncbi:MAG TPA: hypothetical protein VJ986_08610 [Gaiellaceae bacterium]|nr:hypothetical protein [Gaiellaceae bacterium]